MAKDKHHIPGKYDLNAKLGTPVTRWASVAFGAGVGLGRAYTECSYKFGTHSKWEGSLKDSQESTQSFSEVTTMDQQAVNNDLED